jgi:hypothetical protein
LQIVSYVDNCCSASIPGDQLLSIANSILRDALSPRRLASRLEFGYAARPLPLGLVLAFSVATGSISQSTYGKHRAKGDAMTNTPLLCIMVIAAAFAGPADAIFKCTTSKGVVYQDRPCRDGNETDVQIVVPTGQVAPRQSVAPDEGTQAGGSQADNRFVAPKSGRATPDETASVTDRRKVNTASATASDNSRNRDAQASADSGSSPTIPDQARNAEPSAKYYTTEGFGIGTDTPGRLNCESSTGEKRVFYLSNGKLTSI